MKTKLWTTSVLAWAVGVTSATSFDALRDGETKSLANLQSPGPSEVKSCTKQVAELHSNIEKLDRAAYPEPTQPGGRFWFLHSTRPGTPEPDSDMTRSLRMYRNKANAIWQLWEKKVWPQYGFDTSFLAQRQRYKFLVNEIKSTKAHLETSKAPPRHTNEPKMHEEFAQGLYDQVENLVHQTVNANLMAEKLYGHQSAHDFDHDMCAGVHIALSRIREIMHDRVGHKLPDPLDTPAPA